MVLGAKEVEAVVAYLHSLVARSAHSAPPGVRPAARPHLALEGKGLVAQ
jgi:hypothetical protein